MSIIADRVARTPATTAGTGPKKNLRPVMVVSVLVLAIALFSSPFWGAPWHWHPGYGASYGESLKGLAWIHETPVGQNTVIEVGDNITYRWGGKSAMKRVWNKSPDGKWVWVGGDNTADGASSGSCEVGWIKLHGTTSLPPSWPKPNPDTAPRDPIVVASVIDGFWSPFDRRSSFEKTTRFFTDPGKVIVADGWLVLTDKFRSNVYERKTGRLIRHIPGKVTRINGAVADFLKVSAYRCDPLPGRINLENGRIVALAPEPKVAAPKTGEADLRDASLSETSGQNPAKIFDNNPATAWYIGAGCRRIESLTIGLPKPILVREIRVDSRLAYGTTLAVSVSLHGKAQPVDRDFTVNCKVDTIVLTLTQKCRQPVTGQVREVDIIG